jgi:hypothetical protein
MEIVKNIIGKYGILLVSIGFVIVVKIPHLPLPYSWDEAWSYLPALIKMGENGPGLIPGAIPINESKGHPLFYYFLNSGWVKLFSGEMSNIILARIFPLIVSLVLLTVLFVIARKHFSVMVANLSVILLSVQSLFLAQASLILPEMLLALLLLLSFHFFISEKFGKFAITASLMVLTKETGLVFAGIFGLFYVIENKIIIPSKENIPKLFLLTIPLWIFCVHLLLNYWAFNTYFFKEHLDYISFDFMHIKRVIKSSPAILFTRYGRNVISGVIIISILIILFRKEKFDYLKILVLISVQILFLIVFTSLNFYTYRYMLPAFPLFIVLGMILFEQAVRKNVFRTVLIVFMVTVPLYFSLTKKGKTDIDLGYASYLPLHKEMVVYCEHQNWYDENFSAEFNMVLALRDPFTGYHNTSHGFKTSHLPKLEDIDIVILDSTGEWTELPENQKGKFSLIKRFENKNDWGEIYIRTSN